MPINHQIDHDQRLVIASPHGVLTDAEVFDYQMTVWSRPEVKGYNELVDMTAVAKIEYVSSARVNDLANLSASMDAEDAPSKLAIVATNDIHFGLGRMYEARREMAARSNKVVRVFRSRPEALQWLGVPTEPS
jgi:hypothetical protein